MARFRGYSTGSMVLGIISLFSFCLWFVSVPCAVVGIILGSMSLIKKRSRKEMAAGGLVLSLLSIILTVSYLIMYDQIAVLLQYQ